MENRKGSGIFLGVIGVATLIVAIIGATFAYFSANMNSAEDAIQAGGALLSLGFGENARLKTNLIPAEDYIALYGATNAEHIAAKGECKDDYGNEICGVYEFTIGNPSFTTTQTLYGYIKVQTNEFTDLYFRILDENGNTVVQPTNFKTAKDPTTELPKVDGQIDLAALTQKLIPSTDDVNNTNFKADKVETYTKVTNASGESNVRTYKMIIWIEENDDIQNDGNAGKSFAAGVYFTTAGGGTGVTGVISAAEASQQPANDPTGE